LCAGADAGAGFCQGSDVDECNDAAESDDTVIAALFAVWASSASLAICCLSGQKQIRRQRTETGALFADELT
jgi:hypothetical protein